MNPKTSKAADDAFYAAHPELVVDGKRQSLSGSDPGQAKLRNEWWAEYDKVEGREAGKAGKKESQKCTDDPVEPCENNKWITVGLFRFPDTEELPYIWEPFKGTLSDEKKVSGELDGSGYTTHKDIPAGVCEFSFPEFYDDIKKRLLNPPS